MENSKEPSTMRNMYNRKHYSLPPKSPFPSIAPSYADYAPTAVIGPKGMPKYRDGNSHHQRTSSESLLIEEQPSWLDELLDEPETPVRRGHRRSSSDSFTYMEVANANIEHAAQDEYRLRNMTSASSWGSQNFDLYKDARNASFFSEQNSMIKNKNLTWNSPQNTLAHSSGTISLRDSFVLENSTSPGASQEVNGITPTTTKNQNLVESCPRDPNTSCEMNGSSTTQASASETDTKHAKQQFAQRSRVRKLQYIAELERNLQALQAKGSEVSAELKFLNQRSLILSMENKALKQRLENLAQEQFIKHLEHEVLEREIGRLKALYKQQQQPPPEQPVPSRRLTKSRDKVESQFAKLSLKNKESGAVREAVSGPLHI